MNARSLVLALALACTLACDSTSAPAEPTKADAKAEAKTEAKTGAKPELEAEPPPETKRDTKAEPKPDPVAPEPESNGEPVEPIAHIPEPKPPAGPPVLTAGLEPPESSRILALAREKGLGKPAIAAKPAEAGARRYVVALRDREGSAPAEHSLHLLLLRAPEPAPGAAVAWVAEGVLELHRWTSPWLEDAEAGSIPTTLVVDDHERDGEIEVLVRFRHEIMCPGGGPNTITELRIVELEPTLAVVLATELHHAIVSVETKGTAHHEDLDADGHPDLRIAYSTKDADEAKPRLQESRWRWVAAGDTWAPLTTGAKLPPYDRSGCDW